MIKSSDNRLCELPQVLRGHYSPFVVITNLYWRDFWLRRLYSALVIS